MSLLRATILVLGPPVLAAMCAGLTLWAQAPPTLGEPPRMCAPRTDSLAPSHEPETAPDPVSLRTACEAAAAAWPGDVPELRSVVVRPPFVLVGDVPAEVLAHVHTRLLAPLSAELQRTLFRQPPTQPVLVIGLSDEATYRAVARRLDNYTPSAYAGYYVRTARRIVVNLDGGWRTLAHELTHALAHCDFPNLPEWFDEGLAALHEETAWEAEALPWARRAGWRLHLLLAARRGGQIPLVGQVLGQAPFRGEKEGLHYAFAFTLCAYLEERQLLKSYYEALREPLAQVEGAATSRRDRASPEDPSLPVLCKTLRVTSADAIDRLLHDWLEHAEQQLELSARERCLADDGRANAVRQLIR